MDDSNAISIANTAALLNDSDTAKSATKKPGTKSISSTLSKGNQALLNIHAVSVRLTQVGDILGKLIGVTQPQWAMMRLLLALDNGRGASVKEIASMMNVDPSFVSAQARILQRGGVLRRDTSKHDRRSVILSLTPSGIDRMAPSIELRGRIEQLVHADHEDPSLEQLSEMLETLNTRLRKAMLLVAAGD